MTSGEDKLIVERPGHKKVTERVTVEPGQTLAPERAMLEEPSLLAVIVKPTPEVALGAPFESIAGVQPSELTLAVQKIACAHCIS